MFWVAGIIYACFQDALLMFHKMRLTPEAYRKALLEGMEGEVPEAYRAWKKRYYEELVQQ